MPPKSPDLIGTLDAALTHTAAELNALTDLTEQAEEQARALLSAARTGRPLFPGEIGDLYRRLERLAEWRSSNVRLARERERARAHAMLDAAGRVRVLPLVSRPLEE